MRAFPGTAVDLEPRLLQEDTDSDMSDAGGDTQSVGGARRARHPRGMLRTMYRAALRAAATMSSTQCAPVSRVQGLGCRAGSWCICHKASRGIEWHDVPRCAARRRRHVQHAVRAREQGLGARVQGRLVVHLSKGEPWHRMARCTALRCAPPPPCPARGARP